MQIARPIINFAGLLLFLKYISVQTLISGNNKEGTHLTVLVHHANAGIIIIIVFVLLRILQIEILVLSGFFLLQMEMILNSFNYSVVS